MQVDGHFGMASSNYGGMKMEAAKLEFNREMCNRGVIESIDGWML